MKSLLGLSRRADVIFRKNGSFDINARIVHALGMTPGDAIDVMTDGGEYYLYVAHHCNNAICGKYEAQCYPSKGKFNHFRGSSTRLCRAVLSAGGVTDDKAAFPCGEPITDEHERKLIPIIIRLNLAL